MRRTTTIGLDLPAMLGLPDAPDMHGTAGRLAVALAFAHAAKVTAWPVGEHAISAYGADTNNRAMCVLSIGTRGATAEGERAACAWIETATMGPCVPMLIALA